MEKFGQNSFAPPQTSLLLHLCNKRPKRTWLSSAKLQARENLGHTVQDPVLIPLPFKPTQKPPVRTLELTVLSFFAYIMHWAVSSANIYLVYSASSIKRMAVSCLSSYKTGCKRSKVNRAHDQTLQRCTRTLEPTRYAATFENILG